MSGSLKHGKVRTSGGGAPSAALATAGLALATLLPSMSTSSANVALPTLARFFDAPFEDVQWVVLANLLALTALVVSAGRLGDVFGRRRVLLAGIAVFGLASLAAAAAPGLWTLSAARAAQGVGAAAMMALSMALIGDAAAKNKVGGALGLLGTVSATGTALGPSLGGVLIAAFGWHAIFLINVPLAALAWIFIAKAMPLDAPGTARAPFDARGTALLAFTLGAAALAVSRMTQAPVGTTAALLSSAAAGGFVFWRLQRSAASPLVRLSLFDTPAVASGFAMSAAITAIVMASLVAGPFYLALGLQLDAAEIGLAMSAGPIVAALSGAPAGRLADRIGPPAVAVAGLACVSAGAAVLPVTALAFGVAGYVGPLMLITGGYAFFQAANNAQVMTSVASDQRGVASGLLTLARNMGLVTGAAVPGAVFAGVAGADAATAGMQATFACAAVVAIATLIVALRARR